MYAHYVSHPQVVADPNVPAPQSRPQRRMPLERFTAG